MRRKSQPVQGRHTDTGQAAVEFVLTIVFIMFLIFSALELIMMVYTYTVMANAAKEGVRYAVAHGCDVGASNCSGPSCNPACGDASGAVKVAGQVKNYAKLCFHDISGITVTVNYPDSAATTGSRVQVVVNYPYKSFFNLGWKPPTIKAAAEGRITF